MAKAAPPPAIDVLVLGEHPSSYFAAALLKQKSKLNIVHATVPGVSTPDRLVLINPAMFDLHALLSPLKRKLDLESYYGLSFLADDPATRSEHRGKSIVAQVTTYSQVKEAIVKIAKAEGVEFLSPKVIEVHRIDEKGLEMALGRHRVKPKVLVLGAELSAAQHKLLGLPDAWEANVVQRYSFVKFKGAKAVDLGGKPAIPMSLDLHGKLMWAWLFVHGSTLQLAVSQPIESVFQYEPRELVGHWAGVLKRHGVLKAETVVPLNEVESIDLPLAGALVHEGLANRTLSIGPAGGFYSANAEDIYPNLWSAIFAADAIKKAYKQPHLQDALNPYRYSWRTTLGDYLRGPHQNLKFLLPLVYRNQVMSARLTEAILQGKGIVR